MAKPLPGAVVETLLVVNMAPNSQEPIELRLRADSFPGVFHLAGRNIVTDAQDASLAPYQLSHAVTWSRQWFDQSASETATKSIYAGPGWIGRTWRQVVCHQTLSGYQLEIEGIATYRISADGAHIQQTNSNPACTDELLAQTALGAPLVFALALKHTFCLHGSAVSANGGLVLFIGESGDGKSTLASYLDEEGDGYWQRIIDDTLPVQVDEHGQIAALPHFPQLKVPNEKQPVHLVPATMELRAVYVLHPSPTPNGLGVRLRHMSTNEATVRLVQHTVGSRLFPPSLLATHLAFGSSMASQVSVRVLSYPHNLSLLPVIQTQLQSDLE